MTQPEPTDPDDVTQRRDLTARARAAIVANLNDIDQAEQIIAANPSQAVSVLAQHSKAQAKQLNELIRLVLWLGRKTDSGF